MPPTRWPWHRRRRRPPTWQATGPRGRVLLEHPDPRVREVLTTDLREHGYHVLTCAGPTDAEVVGDCPLVVGAACPAVEGADAVVVGGADAHPLHRLVVDRISEAHPQLPVIDDADLRVVSPLGYEVGRHQRYRRIVAPLVRRLHEVLHAPGRLR